MMFISCHLVSPSLKHCYSMVTGTIGEATNFVITEVHTAEDIFSEIGVTFSFPYVHLYNLEVSS